MAKQNPFEPKSRKSYRNMNATELINSDANERRSGSREQTPAHLSQDDDSSQDSIVDNSPVTATDSKSPRKHKRERVSSTVNNHFSPNDYHRSPSHQPEKTKSESLAPPTPVAVPSRSPKIADKHWFSPHRVWLGMLFALALAVICGFKLTQTTASAKSTIYCSFDSVKNEFPKQDDMFWKYFRFSVESVLNEHPPRPSVLLLAHSDTNLPASLISAIVERTAQCLNNEGDAIKLGHADFASPEMNADYGVAVAKLKEPLQNSGLMLVTDINKISAKVAQAFHSICDTVTPMVARSVIILTMHIVNPISESENLLEMVEKQLKSDWSGLHLDVLQPLVARVTDQVLLLQTKP